MLLKWSVRPRVRFSSVKSLVTLHHVASALCVLSHFCLSVCPLHPNGLTYTVQRFHDEEDLVPLFIVVHKTFRRNSYVHCMRVFKNSRFLTSISRCLRNDPRYAQIAVIDGTIGYVTDFDLQ